MVARDFSLQELPYSRLLQMPDDEREFLALDELKPHQLTELGVHHSGGDMSQIQMQQTHQGNLQILQPQTVDMQQSSFGHTIYYDLNTQTAGT